MNARTTLPMALPWFVAAGLYALLLNSAALLLNDPDTYWHLAAGRWIVENRTFPHTDPFSWTHNGEPWITMEWLAQVSYLGAKNVAGWTGVSTLAAAAIATAFGLLTRALLRRLTPLPVLLLVLPAIILTFPHMLARPHVLAFPVMVAWTAGLVRAVDEDRPPPWLLLPIMVVWANVHGGFTLGIALVAPVALEAVIAAPPPARVRAALRWGTFGLAAAAAGCLTPYGFDSILATRRIFGLGEALFLITEWQPQNFARIGMFEIALLGGLAFAFHRGLRLPTVRLLVLLGLLHLALQHARSTELLVMLAPLFLAAPLARQFPRAQPSAVTEDARHPHLAVAAGGLAALALISIGFLSMRTLAPTPSHTPAAAVEAIQGAGVERVLNDYTFGGYLVYSGVPPFIDGRTEIYGSRFTFRHDRALSLRDLPDFLQLLDEYQVDATMLAPDRPAVALLDRLPEWQRLHTDATAVVHIRTRAP